MSLVLALAACTSLPRTVVTITSVVDAASKEYARAYNQGFVPEDVDKKIDAAHAKYREACGVAKVALMNYQRTGNEVDYNTSLAVVRGTVLAILDAMEPYILSAAPYKAKLATTNTL